MIKRIKIRGGALWLTVLVTLLLITYFIGAILSSGKVQSVGAIDSRAELQAHYAALGAINQAFVHLERNPDWTGSWGYEPMPQNADIFHSLESDRGRDGIGANEIYLFAQGYTAQYGEGTPLAAVAGTAYRPSGGLSQACYSDEVLSLIGCTVDSYDAGLGMGYVLPDPNATPSPTPVVTPSGSPTPQPPSHSIVKDRAHVGSNTHVQLNNTRVDGDVILPQVRRRVDATVRSEPVYLDSSYSVYKNTRHPMTGIDLPEIKVPFDTGSGVTVIDSTSWLTLVAPDSSIPEQRVLEPGAYNSVTVPDGGTLIFKPGEYYFEDGFFAEMATERITLKLQSESGETKLFVGREMRLNGVDCRLGDQSSPIIQPGLLKIYGGGTGSTNPDEKICLISLQDTKLSGAVVGQSIQLQTQGCEIWGATMTRTLAAQNTTFHYDVSLRGVELAEHSFWKLRGLTQVNTK